MARKAAETAGQEAVQPGADPRWLWEAIAVGALLPVTVAAVLYRLNVPLGLPGRFVYLYSPVVSWRLQAVPWVIVFAVLVGAGVWLVVAGTPWHRRAGLTLVACTTAAVGIWSYYAPPDHLNQHVFNMQSPSQDGAFLREAFTIEDAHVYLRDYPQRARTPPEQMRGTRVVSNPPGTTMLVLGLRRLSESCEPLGKYLHGRIDLADPELADLREQFAVGLGFTWILTALWVLAGPVLYAAGRLYFPPAGAAAFAVGCLICPVTLLFTPGKDPAQLLTVALLLWLWLLSLRRGWWWSAAASGAVFVLTCMVSLVHVWVAAAAVLASFLDARHTPGRLRLLALRGFLTAAVGAVIAAVALYACCGLNVPATLWAVAQSQGEVTRGPDAMLLRWQLLGIPLFLLFVGPALWTSVLWLVPARGKMRQVDGDARFGRYLLVCTFLVLVATVGFTNIETPRLWIPFLPLLLLGAGLQVSVFRRPAARGARLLIALVVVQIAISSLHWALMDMREAETRLIEQRFFE